MLINLSILDSLRPCHGTQHLPCRRRCADSDVYIEIATLLIGAVTMASARPVKSGWTYLRWNFLGKSLVSLLNYSLMPRMLTFVTGDVAWHTAKSVKSGHSSLWGSVGESWDEGEKQIVENFLIHITAQMIRCGGKSSDMILRTNDKVPMLPSALVLGVKKRTHNIQWYRQHFLILATQ